MSQEPHPLDNFHGTVRLFPLPNLVLFPHVAQPLHIFEPRYRQMMVDALADDGLLTMALLRPGWEEDYHKKPPIHPVVCVGRILQEERLADGRYHLLLQGLCRARIRSEVASTKLYRIARVELCADEPVAVEREKTLRGELGESVKPFFAERSATLVQLQKLLQSPLPLGALSDIFAFVLPLDVEVKQRLLESLCVESRVHLLLANLDKKTPPAPPKEAPSRPFPPEFSSN